MANIFKPLFGKRVTISIQPLAVSEVGLLSSSGAAITFVGRLEEISGGRTETETEPVVPLDCFAGNNVEIGEISRYAIAELMMALPAGRSTVGTGNRLYALVSLCRYFTITVTLKDDGASGGSPASTTFLSESATCRWTSFDPSYRRGNAKCRLEAETCAIFDGTTGVYAANPAVTFTPSL